MRFSGRVLAMSGVSVLLAASMVVGVGVTAYADSSVPISSLPDENAVMAQEQVDTWRGIYALDNGMQVVSTPAVAVSTKLATGANVAGAVVGAFQLGWGIGQLGLQVIAAVTGTTADKMICDSPDWYRWLNGVLSIGGAPSCTTDSDGTVSPSTSGAVVPSVPNTDLPAPSKQVYWKEVKNCATETATGATRCLDIRMASFTTVNSTILYPGVGVCTLVTTTGTPKLATNLSNAVGSITFQIIDGSSTFVVIDSKTGQVVGAPGVSDSYWTTYTGLGNAQNGNAGAFTCPSSAWTASVVPQTRESNAKVAFRNLGISVSSLPSGYTNTLGGTGTLAATDATPAYNADPERQLECTLTLASGKTIVATGATYTDSSGIPLTTSGTGCDTAWAQVPSSDPVTNIATSSTRTDTGATETLTTNPVTPQYTSTLENYPACSGDNQGKCQLVLFRLVGGLLRSCFDSDVTVSCADWYSATTQGTNDLSGEYVCRYGSYDMPLSSCDAYQKSFTSTGTGTITDPSTGEDASTSTVAAGVATSTPDSTNCWASGWSWNPVDWILTPVKCSLEWAFVPDQATLTAAETKPQQEIDTQKATGVGVGAVENLVSGAIGAVQGVGSASECQGPELDLSIMGLPSVDSYPLDACAQPMATLAQWSQIGIGAVFTITCFWALTRYIAAVFGFVGAGTAPPAQSGNPKGGVPGD